MYKKCLKKSTINDKIATHTYTDFFINKNEHFYYGN